MHILKNASGSVRRKITQCFTEQEMSAKEVDALATLIYYPEEKLALLKEENGPLSESWYTATLLHLVQVCRKATSKYTRSKVRKAMPKDFSYIIDELLNYSEADEDDNRTTYVHNIVKSIIEIGSADAFIIAISELIQHAVIDKLHIVGDIFDRGNGAHKVMDALTQRIEFFVEMGCRATDHGLDYVPYREATKEEVNAIYQKAMAGEAVTVEEAEKYQTYILIHLGKQYHRLNVAMQIHYNCLRGVNRKMNSLLGPDTGFDMINTATCGGEIASLLSALNDTDECPKTIIYSLNPGDDAQIGTILGCFQNSEVPGKIQHGSAWWFNDHKIGMEEQMTRLASLGRLGNFVGMLTDSRSFLSYTRHDYFRRILCNIIGQWVEDGEYPNDEKSLEKIVKGICFDNAKRYFNL